MLQVFCDFISYDNYSREICIFHIIIGHPFFPSKLILPSHGESEELVSSRPFG